MTPGRTIYTARERDAAFDRIARRGIDLCESAKNLEERGFDEAEFELLFEVVEAIKAEAAFLRSVVARSPEAPRKRHH